VVRTDRGSTAGGEPRRRLEVSEFGTDVTGFDVPRDHDASPDRDGTRSAFTDRICDAPPQATHQFGQPLWQASDAGD
jgi:hypothetical protein